MKAVTVGVSTSIVAALFVAPYLPRLVSEGYPQETWPAPGVYADVAGVHVELDSSTANSTLIEPLSKLFGDSKGRALLAMHDGRIVMEHYAPGVTRETRLNSYSLVKGLIGVLVLMAVAEGKIPSLDTKVGAILADLTKGPPAGNIRGSAYGFAQIPICRFLDMRSGIVFQPDAAKQQSGFDTKDLETTKYNPFGPMARLHMTGLAGVEKRLFDGANDTSDLSCSGGHYSYQNVNTAILGAALESVYRRPLEQLLSEKIWEPAGAAPASWRRYAEGGSVTPYCCLFARPLDWLLVAQFIVQNGRPGAPMLPDNLWQELMGLDLDNALLRDGVYRHHTYHNVLDRAGEAVAGRFAYFFGSRGQAVYLMPEQKLAVVRFGSSIQKLHSTLYGVARSIGLGSEPHDGAAAPDRNTGINPRR